jgi:hypothetical protein
MQQSVARTSDAATADQYDPAGEAFVGDDDVAAAGENQYGICGGSDYFHDFIPVTGLNQLGGGSTQAERCVPGQVGTGNVEHAMEPMVSGKEGAP